MGAGRKGSADADQSEALKKKRNSITGIMVERFKPQSSEEIREVVAALTAEMQAAKSELNIKQGSLQSQLGSALYVSNIKIPELVKKWTTSAKGVVGSATKVDFRKYVRTVLDWPNVKEIDSFFTQLDTDGDGALTPVELTGVITKLIDQARAEAAVAEKIEARVDFFRGRVKTASEVADTTADAENADARLEMITNNKAPDARLGAELLRRNTKIGDLLKSWESTEGEVDKKQFRKNVRTFGVDDKDDALDAMFDSIDQDGGGTLDLEELKSALNSLREASLESDREVDRLKRRSAEQWKAAKMAQLELKKLRKADEVAEAARVEAEAKELEERKAMAEVKAAEAQAKKDAAAKAKAEEQAAYEAKIAMRRASSASGLGAVKVVAGKVVKA